MVVETVVCFAAYENEIEFVHAVLVAGKNDHEILTLLLHDVQQNLDRFSAPLYGV